MSTSRSVQAVFRGAAEKGEGARERQNDQGRHRKDPTQETMMMRTPENQLDTKQDDHLTSERRADSENLENKSATHPTFVLKNATNSPKLHHRSEERVKLASSVCQSRGFQIKGAAQKVYVYEAQKVAYCSTHKIASTYWIRIYRWLYNDTPSGHVASPLLISKFDTHLAPLSRLRVRDLSHTWGSGRALIENSYRFLFTRDPYARLWSVYIDKFVLPDNYFWAFYGPRIRTSVYGKAAKMPARFQARKVPDTRNLLLRPNQGDLSRVKNSFNVDDGENGNSSTLPRITSQSGLDPFRSASCPGVTFQEFLQYIVNVAAAVSGQALDDHFRPIHYGCNPCQFHPHFIGHLETMGEDSAHVLSRMKLDQVSRELQSNHVEQEIRMLIDFNFQLVVRMRLQRDCVTDADLERRLVKAFIYNGYVSPESEGWLDKQLPLGQANFTQTIMRLYHDSEQTSEVMRKQRDRYKSEAFRQIPMDLLLAIQKLFHWDFVLFGYDPSPPEIFDGV